MALGLELQNSVQHFAFTDLIISALRVSDSFCFKLRLMGLKYVVISLTLRCCNKMLCFQGTLGHVRDIYGPQRKKFYHSCPIRPSSDISSETLDLKRQWLMVAVLLRKSVIPEHYT